MSDVKNTASAAAIEYDVAILGGGLAGLTLALQLKKARPASNILVIEKQKHPVPEAAHKVGESTVDIAAHYLQNVLGLAEHLQTQQLRKFALQFFFSAGNNQDITRRAELGLAAPSLVPTYQLDRGRLENALGHEIQELGITFLDTCKVEGVSLQHDAPHTLQVRQGEKTLNVSARWVVDASGRSSLLKRQLGLAKKVAHQANAVWFRVGQKIDIDEWSDSPEWHARITNGRRYLSTIHLCGEGYWVWLIPLASGSTSVGIVTDPAFHAFDGLNRFERALQWLHEHEPQCAAVIEQCQENIQDFLVMKNYAYSCEQVFSSDRWCLTGEAGVFVDPLYSPGSDFIAMSNSFICDIISRELNGEDVRERARTQNYVFLTIANAWFYIYEQQYGLLGNAQVMIAKYIWDTALYWGVFGLLFFHNKLLALADNRNISLQVHGLTLLGARIQTFFRGWAEIDQTVVTDTFIDYFETLDFMREFQVAMTATLTDTEFEAQFAANVRLLERLAGQMVSTVIEDFAPLARKQHVTSTDEAATLKQIQCWRADPFLSKAMAAYQQEDGSDLSNRSWINPAKQGRNIAEVVS